MYVASSGKVLATPQKAARVLGVWCMLQVSGQPPAPAGELLPAVVPSGSLSHLRDIGDQYVRAHTSKAGKRSLSFIELVATSATSIP